MAENKLFRKAALDRLSSPEQLHTLMRVTNAKGWLALVGCALIIVTALTWGTLGSVQTKVGANGILLRGGGMTELDSDGEGDVVSIDVKTGELVKKGQVVAHIEQPALAQQIATVETRLAELRLDADGGVPSTTNALRRDGLQSDLDNLKKRFEEGARVLSNVDGRVVELRAAVGERVTPGRTVVVVEKEGEGSALEVLLYFDSAVGKSLEPGMTIEIVPSVVRKERHGVLLGKVKAVDQFPSTRMGMMGALRNEQLVDGFIQSAGGAPIAVRAELLADPSTPSGYRWSSGGGPSVILTSGTRCTGAVITRTHRPIALVFPALDQGG